MAAAGGWRSPGYVEMTGEPIRNKVTGEESRAQISLPDGFEYEVADIGSASSRTTGGPMQIEIDEQIRAVREPASVHAMVSSTPDLTSRVLRHERLIVAGGIALLVGLCWWFVRAAPA